MFAHRKSEINRGLWIVLWAILFALSRDRSKAQGCLSTFRCKVPPLALALRLRLNAVPIVIGFHSHFPATLRLIGYATTSGIGPMAFGISV